LGFRTSLNRWSLISFQVGADISVKNPVSAFVSPRGAVGTLLLGLFIMFL
jgi:hypothetical protein